MTTLITGATGFVGSQLLAAARGRGDAVRVLVRDASAVDPEGIEVVEGDLGETADLRRALQGVDCAYYLVHSMESDGDFARRDREFAERFARCAQDADVRRIVYLGGVRPEGDESEHLESRGEVEDLLAQRIQAFVALRASMIVGARSDSFRALAGMVDRLPVLPMPSWRTNRTRPIAIADVVEALLAAQHVEPGRYEIGGPQDLSFEEMVKTVGELLGRGAPVVPLPVSVGRLEAAVASTVTDVDRAVLEPVMHGMHADLRIEGELLQDVFGVTPTPFDVASAAALAELADDGALQHAPVAAD